MLWSVATAALTGFLLGLRYRAPALIAATAVTVIFGAATGGVGVQFDWQRLFSIVLLVVSLQCAYLLGVLVTIVWRNTWSAKREA